jgi:hypothetical protein
MPPGPEPAQPAASSPLADDAPRAVTGQDPRLAAIKALLFDQSKFLSSCLNPLAAWRFEDGAVHFIYPRGASWAVDLMKSREHQERLTSVCEQVLGQPVRICVTLQEGRTQTVAQRPSARERAGGDAMLAAFQRRFDCAVLDIKDLSRE